MRDSMFLHDCWYVAAWVHETPLDQPFACEILDQPIVIFRTDDGQWTAMADRCPHRHAPLSLGRVEGNALRCMYHGLLFDRDGSCLSVPGSNVIPPSSNVRTYPVVAKDGWLWVWLGDAQRADEALIPKAFGLDNPSMIMRASKIDYAANYMLINDNLCDLSHVDFVHETTLSYATGGGWAHESSRVRAIERGIRVQRWFIGKPASPGNPTLVDTWSTYDYLVPGIFIMENRSYPHGHAETCGFGSPRGEPMTYRVEQQAVTPISNTRTRYFFASGIESKFPVKVVEAFFDVVMEAFGEDRAIIEAQQNVWDKTSAGEPMAFIVHDKGPAIFRKVVTRLIREEFDRNQFNAA